MNSIIVEGYHFKEDDCFKYCYAKDWYPANNTCVYLLDNGKFQAVQQGESLGDFNYAEKAIECLENWLMDNGKLIYIYND